MSRELEKEYLGKLRVRYLRRGRGPERPRHFLSRVRYCNTGWARKSRSRWIGRPRAWAPCHPPRSVRLWAPGREAAAAPLRRPLPASRCQSPGTGGTKWIGWDTDNGRVSRDECPALQAAPRAATERAN
jgi:hypothetical protein